jgi:hypothetical protein
LKISNSKLEYKFINLKSIKHHSEISFDYERIVNSYLELFPAVRYIHAKKAWDAASIRARALGI